MAFTTNFDAGADYEDTLQDYSTTALQQAEALANRQFTPYEGERVAGFTADEIAGRQRAIDLANQGIGRPQLEQAAQTYGGVAGYQAGQIDPSLIRDTDIVGEYAPSFGRVDPALMAQANLGQYMSPYQQGVTDIALREMDRRRQIEEQGLGAQASAAGAFGGSRQAILEAELARNYGQRAADVITQGQQQAFLNAQQQAAGDLSRMNEAQRQNIALGAQEFGIGADLASADIGRMNQAQLQNEALRSEAAKMQLAGAQGLQQVAPALRSAAFGDADILRTIGGQERALEQARLEVPYQEFMREQAFPTEALSARLAPLGFGAQVASAAPTVDDPSFLQQTLGGIGYLSNIAGGLGKAGIIGGSGSGSLFEF